MERTRPALRRTSTSASTGTRNRRVALATALATFALPVACAGNLPDGLPPDAAYRAARASIEAGLELYAAGESIMAARRFQDASYRANVYGDEELERTAVAAECMAWLRAQEVPKFAACTERLEFLQRESRRSDPGVNALIALGAVAGDRPLPPLRIPHAVAPIVRAAAEGSP